MVKATDRRKKIREIRETFRLEHVKKLKTPIFEGIENVSRPEENRV